MLAGSGTDPAGRVAYVRTVHPATTSSTELVSGVQPPAGQPAPPAGITDVQARGLQPAGPQPSVTDVQARGLQPGGPQPSVQPGGVAPPAQHTVVVSADINTVSNGSLSLLSLIHI